MSADLKAIAISLLVFSIRTCSFSSKCRNLQGIELDQACYLPQFPLSECCVRNLVGKIQIIKKRAATGFSNWTKESYKTSLQVNSNLNISLELRQVSLRYEKHQIIDLHSAAFKTFLCAVGDTCGNSYSSYSYFPC